MISKDSIFQAIAELDKNHNHPVAHSFLEIVVQLGAIQLDYVTIDHMLWMLVTESKILKIGLDSNYQRCHFIQTNIDQLKQKNDSRVKELGSKLTDAYKKTKDSVLNFKSSKKR